MYNIEMLFLHYTNPLNNPPKKAIQATVSGGAVIGFKPKSDLFNIAFAKSNDKLVSGKGVKSNIRFIL